MNVTAFVVTLIIVLGYYFYFTRKQRINSREK
ncbi:hypothetical protein SDC9_22974 [bioreactor metagenome]|uniref:Uncharacterized protein n=1 Tax=bioreactor metagenome TaxID=1076179 RepID=A0A644UDP9_9ZZZZ